MTQPQHDMQAHGEQIRHAQIAGLDSYEKQIERAATTASDDLAETEGRELFEMIAKSDDLTERLDRLLEQVSAMGVGEAAGHDAIIAAAGRLFSGLLQAQIGENVRDVIARQA